MPRAVQRRRYLRTAAAIGAAGLAGCGFLDPQPDRPYDPVATWLVAPAVDDRAVGYAAESRSPATFATAEPIPAETRESAAGWTSFDWGQIDPASVERTVEVDTAGHAAVPRYAVHEGSFDAGRVGDDLLGAGATPTGRHEGYDLYRDADAGRTYGVGDGRLLVAGGPESTGTAAGVRTVVDAGTGATDRLLDRDADVGEVADRIEPGLQSALAVEDPTASSSAETGEFSGVVATGLSWTLAGEDVETTEVFVFDRQDDISTAALDRYAARVRDLLPYDGYGFRVDGYVVVFSGTAPAEAMLS